MPSVPRNPPNVTTSGILATPDGARVIPSSLRPDGTKRKEIQIRPGYRPPEDVEIYKNRNAQAFKEGGKGGGKGPIPGAEALSDKEDGKGAGAGAGAPLDKNAKKRAAKKKAKAAAAAEGGEEAPVASSTARLKPSELSAEEKEKQAKAIRKKIRQANDLKTKKDSGESLLPEQMDKVIRLAELMRQLNALGFDE
ncbi:hypothetical protein DFH27DRAFT_482218 [Peziza echinospora]|nr:hypothetical protein DFH27DRAFT_482218 [Peziza echinospora]